MVQRMPFERETFPPSFGQGALRSKSKRVGVRPKHMIIGSSSLRKLPEVGGFEKARKGYLGSTAAFWGAQHG